MANTNTNDLVSLLKQKEDLKLQVKRAKEKVEAQQKAIDRQKVRAENGQTNTLAFEQRQQPLAILELQEAENKLKEVKIKIKAFELVRDNLNLRKKDNRDADGFPINDKGEQIAVLDENKNVLLPLNSNFLVKFENNSFIKINPNDKLEVYKGLDNLVNILTNEFKNKLESHLDIGLTDEARQKGFYLKNPLKVHLITMYFDWINKWLKYFGNVFNLEFKLLFYSKYKEKIKNELLSIETGIYENQVPKHHIEYAKKWIEITDANINLERQAKKKTQKPQYDIKVMDEKIILIELSNHFLKNEVSHEYEAHKRNIQEQRYLPVRYKNRKCKIYSASLSYLFSSNEVKARNFKTQKNFELDIKPYFDTFINAFEKGEKHFTNDYEVSKDILYGTNSEAIVSDIHFAYYHTIHKDKFNGWVGVTGNPTLITHTIIEDYGFYSGVLSKADEFINKYPNVFKDFHKCKDENQAPQQDYFESLKSLAIIKTTDYFKDKHNISVDAKILNSYLDLEKIGFESQLKTNSNYNDIGEPDKIKDNLLKYLNETVEQISEYEMDVLGITTNGLNNDKNGLIKDYSLMQFYNLFHADQIKKTNLMKIKNRDGWKIKGQDDIKIILGYFKETAHQSPLSFDVFTQNYDDYISEFNQKHNQIDNLIIDYELKLYCWLKDVANYVFRGIDYKDQRHKTFVDEQNIEAEMLKGKNPKKVYDNCFRIVEFLEQQSNKDKADEVKADATETKHPHIFKNNAFDVWQSMYDSFNINDSSRTDVKFMYEEMKKDGLIFQTVNQKTFLEWISKNYQIVIQKTSNYSKTPIRNGIYSNAKQLYKE